MKYILWLVILSSFARIIICAFEFSETTDERFHRNWGYKFVFEGDGSRELQYENSKTPITSIHGVIYKTSTNYFSKKTSLILSRIPGLIFYGFCVFLFYLVSKELFKEKKVAFLGTLFFLMDPNLIAHSAVATVDVPFVFCILLIFYLLIRIKNFRDSFRLYFFMGVACAFSLAVKFSSLLFMPCVFGSLIYFSFKLDYLKKSFLLLAVFGLSFLVFLNSFYLFDGVFESYSSYKFQSSVFKKIIDLPDWFPIPISKVLVNGIDISLSHERKIWNVVMDGVHYPHGFSTYFLICWFLKTPTVCVLLISVSVLNLFLRYKEFNKQWILIFLFYLPVLLYFSLIFKTQVGYRFIFMLMPFFYLFVCQFFEVTRNSANWFNYLLFGSIVLEIIPFMGNELAFSNKFLIDKSNAHRYLVDSNLDWGQTRKKVYKIAKGRAHLVKYIMKPGPNIISVNYLAGVYGGVKNFRWIRENIETKDHVLFTHLFFNLSKSDYLNYLRSSKTLFIEDLSQTKKCLTSNSLRFRRSNFISSKGIKVVCVRGKRKGFLIYFNSRKRIYVANWNGSKCNGWKEIHPYGDAIFFERTKVVNLCIWNRDINRLRFTSRMTVID